MINSCQANKKTLEIIQRDYSDKLNDIYNKIDDASTKGKFYVIIEGILEDPIQTYLVNELGYILIPKYNTVTSRDNKLTNAYVATEINWSKTTNCLEK